MKYVEAAEDGHNNNNNNQICIIYLFFLEMTHGEMQFIFSNNPFKHDYANHSPFYIIFMYNQENTKLFFFLLLYLYNIDCI